jgi:hypothetical protein
MFTVHSASAVDVQIYTKSDANYTVNRERVRLDVDILPVLLEFASDEMKQAHATHTAEPSSVAARDAWRPTEAGHWYTYLKDGQNWVLYDDAKDALVVSSDSDRARMESTATSLQFRVGPGNKQYISL